MALRVRPRTWGFLTVMPTAGLLKRAAIVTVREMRVKGRHSTLIRSQSTSRRTAERNFFIIIAIDDDDVSLFDMTSHFYTHSTTKDSRDRLREF